MARAYLVFDFGSNEEAVQEARHRIDGWKQRLRLGNKIQFKLERQTPTSEGSQDSKEHNSKNKHASAKQGHADQKGPGHTRMLIRLDFSGHEKHLFQTWLDRIPGGEPFKSAKSQIIQNDADSFEQTSDLFDSLD